jgi:DNA-binding transcriptional regulator PaaX
VNVTTDDLMDALRAAMGDGTGDGRTVQEICEASGWGATKVRAELGRLHRAGRLEVVRVKRADLTGRMQSLPAYRMKDA